MEPDSPFVMGELDTGLTLNPLHCPPSVRDILAQPGQRRQQSQKRLFLALPCPCKRGINTEEISQGLRSGLEKESSL